MMKALGITLSVLVLAVGTPAAASAQQVSTSNGSGVARFALIAGQNTTAGEVTVRVHSGNVVVTYATAAGWSLVEAQAWAGSVIADLPQTSVGNPSPGQFPSKATPAAGSTTQTFSIPLTSAAINFACPSANAIYYLAAHATVKRTDGSTETAWSAGSRLTAQGSWATFSTFTLTCPKTKEPAPGAATTVSCQTAFARDGGANADFLRNGFQRWGWSNGPYAPGRYTLELWAAAGQSHASKGYLAGTVSVDYTGSIATVTYEMRSGWTLNETHVYAGGTMFPQVKRGSKMTSTVSPGQFPQRQSLDAATSHTVRVAVTGPIYVIAHAAACGAQ